MQITIASVGRMKPGPEASLIATYINRLPWQLQIREVDLRGKLDPATRLDRETAGLLDFIESADHIIALDERGKSLSSTDLAGHLQHQQDEGRRHIAFLIGGADGLGEDLRRKANLMLSFGKATWPHMLVRVMLVEQIYRAYTIANGHPYHREG